MNTNKINICKTISIIFVFTFYLSFNGSSQIPSKSHFFAKQWSVDYTLEVSKIYLLENIISISETEERLVLDVLNASNSGQISSICYSGDSAKTTGMLLAFYGNYWNDNGVIYQGYSFKNFHPEKAVTFLKKLLEVSEKNQKFLDRSYDNNNIIFKFEDLTIIIYSNSATKFRILWNGFDSEWSYLEAQKTLLKFEAFIAK
jgi:hypothetical protein